MFKFYNNGGNQKLKAWSFQPGKNYFCMLNIERPITHQSSITFFFIHPVYTARQKYVQPFATSFGKKGIHTESEKIAFYQPITYQQTISDY